MPEKDKIVFFSLKVLCKKFSWVSFKMICCSCLGYVVKIIVLKSVQNQLYEYVFPQAGFPIDISQVIWFIFL